jgi:arabinofuranan 3-O-arabinosyltransferase
MFKLKTNNLFKNITGNLPLIFILFVLIVCAFIFIGDTINHRFWLSDFKVYYLASKAFIENKQVYGITFGLGSGFYKYSPFILILFLPFTLVPYQTAAVIYYMITVILLIILFSVVRNFMTGLFDRQKIRNEVWALIVSFMFILTHVFRELHLGNTNILLLLLLLLSLQFVIRSKYILAGIILGLAILLKPFFLILWLPLLFHKKFKVMAGFLIFIVFQALVIMIFCGISGALSFHADWYNAMMQHSSAYMSNYTWDSILRMHLFPGLPGYFQYVIILLFCLLYGMFHIFNKYLIKRPVVNGSLLQSGFLFESLVFIAAIPNLVRTDSQHFLFSLPLITLIVYSLWVKRNYWLMGITIILFSMYALNIYEIWGRDISQKIDNFGTLGIGNLLIILTAIWVYSKFRVRLKT